MSKISVNVGLLIHRPKLNAVLKVYSGFVLHIAHVHMSKVSVCFRCSYTRCMSKVGPMRDRR